MQKITEVGATLSRWAGYNNRMLTEYLHILFTLPTAGYGLAISYSAYQLWQANEQPRWMAIGTALTGALMLGSAWFLWRGDNAGFTLLLLALLALHSVIATNETNSNQRQRFVISLVLLALAYLAIT
jgi:hypothetical protein